MQESVGCPARGRTDGTLGTKLRERFSAFARSVNSFSASPQATALAFVIVLVWAGSGPFFRFSDAWQLVINTGTTIVTFLMVFVLNNAQCRDTSAMNAKLDALILALDACDNRLVGLERRTEAEANVVQKQLEAAIETAA